MLYSRPTPSRIERYATLGIERLLTSSSSAGLVSAEFTMRELDEVTSLVQQHA